MPTTEQKQTESVKIAVKLGFFSGMLKAFQSVVFRDLKAAGIDAKVAHKIAIDYGSQLGNAMSNDENIRHKVSKANKDGMARMSGAFYDKLKMHNSMALVRVVQTVSDLKQEGLLQSYTVVVSDLAERIQDYVSECEVWTSEQTWEEKKV